jgi:hypothetical protein
MDQAMTWYDSNIRVREAAIRFGALCLSLALAASAASISAQQRTRPMPMPPPSADDDRRPNPVQTRPLPDIVARVQSAPPYSDMDYIGVAGFETRTMIYTLRFLDGRQVVIVYVDARSGRIIGRSR